jgi:membrane-associated phospholipid phosphatase
MRATFHACRCPVTIAITVAALGAPVHALPAQLLATDTMRVAREEARQPDRRLLTRADMRLFTVFAAAAAAATSYDQRVAREFEESDSRRSAPVARAAAAFRTLGDPGVLAISASAYAAGLVTRRPTLADVGLHATEAIVVSGAATAVIKGLVGRTRPYAVGGADADEFRPGRGWGANTAFPSGHTTVAFAAAAATYSELSRSRYATSHLAIVRLSGAALYGSATLVGISRLYHDKHWTSDVVAGAAVGTVVGRALVRRQHAGPPGRLERWLLPSAAGPSGGGMALGWDATFR